jgi:ADP/ATP carrier protein family
MQDSSKKNFSSKFKDIFWPIEKSELSLFVPMALMMLCMLFNFGALRSVKDGLVVPNIGAEVISFLKLWLVLPSTIIFTLLYVKLSNLFNYEQVFYLIVSAFLGFFALFTWVLYPNQLYFHPPAEKIQALALLWPNFKWFILIAGKWSYAIMYVFCELWSAVVINLLFWQYANHIFDTKSAKRFYPVLGMVGNLGLIIAGSFLVTFSDFSGIGDNFIAENYAFDIEFQSSRVLKPIMTAIIFSGVLAMILYRYIDKYALKSKNNSTCRKRSSEDTKTTLSVLESIKLLLGSRYIGHIVILILCYGLLINILEGPWKARVRELYPNTIDYINFMGRFNIWMGISCVSFMIIGSNIIRRFSWLTSALITPFMLTCTGLVFFIFVIFASDINFFGEGFNPIYFAVIIGAVQNILSKSTKYSLFDSTKEMTYIPLPLELRTKGKAAVEVVGLKFGKSLGAFIQSFMFILIPMATFDSVTVYLMIIFIVVMIIWVWNMQALNKEYLKLRGAESEIN